MPLTAGMICAADCKPTDRRCFGFFHPAMPDEPLIFVEVALNKGVPTRSKRCLPMVATPSLPKRRTRPSSIPFRTVRQGLAGISFGNSLIKQVVADLARDLPRLETL